MASKASDDRLLGELVGLGMVRRGDFLLKSGERSSVYVDMRLSMGYPDVFFSVCRQLCRLIPERDVALVGVPTAGVPYAAVLAAMLRLPLITCREQPKGHGLQKAIEGDNQDRDLVMIEDVLTTGLSVQTWAKTLTNLGKRIRKIATIVDRRTQNQQQTQLPWPVESLFTLEQVERAAQDAKSAYGGGDPFRQEATKDMMVGKGGRRLVVKNRRVQALLGLVHRKRTNLVVSIDQTCPAAIVEMIHQIGPHACAIKLHWDLIDFADFDDLASQAKIDPTSKPLNENGKRMGRAEFVAQLGWLKIMYDFLVIEDRKFGDIGVVSGQQLDRLPACVDMVTAHAVAGASTLAELDKRGVGLLVVWQMSSSGNLLDKAYQDKAHAMLDKLQNIVGVIGQEAHPAFLTMTPGIHLDAKQDNSGQTYKPPSTTSGDLFITGRAICDDPHPAAAAQLYQQKCWNLFQPPLRSRL